MQKANISVVIIILVMFDQLAAVDINSVATFDYRGSTGCTAIVNDKLNWRQTCRINVDNELDVLSTYN